MDLNNKNMGTFKRLCQQYQVIRWIVVLILLLIFIVSAYCTFIAKTTHVQNLQSSLEKSTIIYDADNNKAGKIYAQKGTYVGYNDISSNIPNAILSTEDRNFYHEHGFSVKGFGRAIWLMVKNKILRREYISGGGSTLTQQLVKNAYLTQQQTFSRKLKELFLSIQVENVYSKQQILTMYMNNSYFGNGVYGVEDASQRYFGMHAKNLPVQDAAVIAGMLTNPSAYNPVNHPQLALQRRNVVLQLMADNHKITNATANQLKKLPIIVRDTYKYNDGYKYPYYFDSVIDEAINKYGLSESDIMNRGYKIYTTLNQSQQTNLQNDFDNDNMFPNDASDGTKVQAASIAIDPTTGGVSAVVGGRGEHVFRGYNRATQIKRQPGSTIKPLAVYTPALENGYAYNSLLQNKKLSYNNGKYTPQNYNDVYTGNTPMYQALAQSMNAPAVWLLNKLGVQKGYDSVKSFGLPVTSQDKNLPLALGGLSSGVSPQQMATAYTAFANGGKLTSSYYIRKIVDSSGKVIVDNTNNISSKRIMSQKVANQMTSMMLGVFDNGTGATAKPVGYQVAGKTGSTEADNTGDNDATRDKWIIGYTPKVVVATWEGFDNTNSNHHLENLSGTGVGPLFKTELQQILPTTGDNDFTVQDAAYLDQKQKNKNSKNNSFWDDVKQGADNISKNVKKGLDNLKKNTANWWNTAKKYVED
jgi:penicillin-binding protein 2A